MFETLQNWFRHPDHYSVWLIVPVELIIAAFMGAVIFVIVSQITRRILKRTPWGLDDVLYEFVRPPARVLIPLLFIALARQRQRSFGTPEFELAGLDRLIQLAIIAVITWAVIAAVGALVKFTKQRHRLDVADNNEARRVHTQVTVIGRTTQVLIVIIGLAVALMTFPLVKQVGTSLLASAGLAGLAIGLAARPVLENLIAGVQIGLTQPIRLDDVVIVDGEYGRVEQITLTYIVVKVWDERRLVLPFSKFLTDSFQNWTRNGSQILGTVFLWLDYTAPVEPIKQAARRIVEAHPLWDKRVFAAQVTDLTDRALQFRVLVSATNAGAAFDLRVAVREQLLEYVQREHPQALPLTRYQFRVTDAQARGGLDATSAGEPPAADPGPALPG